jgi:hypothetical protein
LLISIGLLIAIPGASGQSLPAPRNAASWPDGDFAYTDDSYLRLRVDVYPGSPPDHVRWYDPQGSRTYFTSSGPGNFSYSHYVYSGGVLVGIQHFYSIPGEDRTVMKIYDSYSGGVHSSRTYYFLIASETRQAGQYKVEGCETATCDNPIFTDYFQIDYRYKTLLPLVLRGFQ